MLSERSSRLEAIALACQNFVSNYTAEVDGKSWRQSELEEKIRFAEQQLAELERKSQLATLFK